MQPILIALASLSGVPLGLWLRRNLATLRYRHEDEQDLPRPGSRWWVVWTSVLALGGLAAAAYFSVNPLLYLALVPVAVAGPWLAAVDFDVLRIPNRALVPTGAATLLAVAGVAVAEYDWRALVVPVVSGLVTGGAFVAIHFATKGGVGFGDAKLASAIGLALGSLGAGAVWLAVLTGSIAAIIWPMTIRRVGPIPYGPWLLLGAWTAAVAAPAVGVEFSASCPV